MFKVLSTFVVAGVAMLAGSGSVRACGGCSYSAPARAAAKAPSAPAATASSGRQSIRRYSMAPGASYRAPAMSYGRRSSGGPAWDASRKVRGF